MNKYFLYANYYYNFGFNVTCILNERNEHTSPGPVILKSPSHEWTHFKNTRQSLKTLHSYKWGKAKGIGIVLGYNGLRALDIDECYDFSVIPDFLSILDLPSDYEWVMKSGSHNGFHILFYADEHKFEVAKNKIKAFKSERFKHIELRWIGHLVLPPSIHFTLNNYEFLKPIIPKFAPTKINNDNLYLLLDKYCKRKSQEKQTKKFMADNVRLSKVLRELNISIDRAIDFLESKSIEIEKRPTAKISAEVYELLSGEFQNDASKKVASKEPNNISPIYIDDSSSSSEEVDNEDEDELVESSITSRIYIDDSSSSSEEVDNEDKLVESSIISRIYIDDSSSSSEEIDNTFSQPYYLFFDTETTGVPNDWNTPLTAFSNWPRLVQLAYLLYDSKGTLILSNETLIKPDGFSIPKDASDVHGITTEFALNNGNGINEVLSNFEEQCLKSKYLVAHNINFDSKIMGSEFLRNTSRNPISKLQLLCTMEASTDFCKIEGYYGYKWPKLSELHIKLFGVDFEGAHNALADIEATARCFWEMRKLKLI